MKQFNLIYTFCVVIPLARVSFRTQTPFGCANQFKEVYCNEEVSKHSISHIQQSQREIIKLFGYFRSISLHSSPSRALQSDIYSICSRIHTISQGRASSSLLPLPASQPFIHSILIHRQFSFILCLILLSTKCI